jgi:hypothetical protein
MLDITQLCLDIKGTLKEPDPANPTTIIKRVYQATSPQFANYYTKNGKPRMVRAYVAVVNPKTSAQLVQQNKLRLAVAAWHTASDLDKEPARTLAKQRDITIYMAYLSLWMKSYIAPVGTIWDSGATTWDSAATLWDV